MTAIKYRTANVDGFNVSYRESGPSGGPKLLLLHGFPTASHMFRDLIPLLDDRFHIVAPDLPGFGRSDMPGRGYTFDKIAEKIDRFGKGPWQNVVGYRDPVGEMERPHGKWNLLELVTEGNTVRQYVNGKLANEGTDPFPKEGKILIQSEGAEVYFRDIKVYPLQ